MFRRRVGERALAGSGQRRQMHNSRRTKRIYARAFVKRKTISVEKQHGVKFAAQGKAPLRYKSFGARLQM